MERFFYRTSWFRKLEGRMLKVKVISGSGELFPCDDGKGWSNDKAQVVWILLATICNVDQSAFSKAAKIIPV